MMMPLRDAINVRNQVASFFSNVGDIATKNAIQELTSSSYDTVPHEIMISSGLITVRQLVILPYYGALSLAGSNDLFKLFQGILPTDNYVMSALNAQNPVLKTPDILWAQFVGNLGAAWSPNLVPSFELLLQIYLRWYDDPNAPVPHSTSSLANAATTGNINRQMVVQSSNLVFFDSYSIATAGTINITLDGYLLLYFNFAP